MTFFALSLELTWNRAAKEHGCRDAGGRATQEQLPRIQSSPLNWRDNSQRINPNADLLWCSIYVDFWQYSFCAAYTPLWNKRGLETCLYPLFATKHLLMRKIMLHRLLSLILLPILFISFSNQLLASGSPSSSGKWEPDSGGAYLQYGFSGGSIESVSESSTHRNLIMEGTASPGQLLSTSCTGTQPGRDTQTTTIQSTLVMAYIKTSPSVVREPDFRAFRVKWALGRMTRTTIAMSLLRWAWFFITVIGSG